MRILHSHLNFFPESMGDASDRVWFHQDIYFKKAVAAQVESYYIGMLYV